MNRYKVHLGYRVDFTTGFDCYGTAIEHLAIQNHLQGIIFPNKSESLKLNLTFHIVGKSLKESITDYNFSERYDNESRIENKEFDSKALKTREIIRSFVKTSIKDQIEGYLRWGIMHDYRYSYMSISHSYEANVLDTFAQLMTKGMVYRTVRPVYWSAKEQRVLAEEEIESKESFTKAYLVKFRIKDFGEQTEQLKH